MIPVRLYPYYLLAKLYLDMGLTEKACEMAEIVRNKTPKVESNAVTEMREELKNICSENVVRNESIDDENFDMQ